MIGRIFCRSGQHWCLPERMAPRRVGRRWPFCLGCEARLAAIAAAPADDQAVAYASKRGGTVTVAHAKRSRDRGARTRYTRGWTPPGAQ